MNTQFESNIEQVRRDSILMGLVTLVAVVIIPVIIFLTTYVVPDWQSNPAPVLVITWLATLPPAFFFFGQRDRVLVRIIVLGRRWGLRRKLPFQPTAIWILTPLSMLLGVCLVLFLPIDRTLGLNKLRIEVIQKGGLANYILVVLLLGALILILADVVLILARFLPRYRWKLRHHPFLAGAVDASQSFEVEADLAGMISELETAARISSLFETFGLTKLELQFLVMYVQGYSRREIARLMGYSIHNVDMIRSRALQRIRETMSSAIETGDQLSTSPE